MPVVLIDAYTVKSVTRRSRWIIQKCRYWEWFGMLGFWTIYNVEDNTAAVFSLQFALSFKEIMSNPNPLNLKTNICDVI